MKRQVRTERSLPLHRRSVSIGESIRTLGSRSIMVIALLAGGFAYLISGAFHWAYLTTIITALGFFSYADQA